MAAPSKARFGAYSTAEMKKFVGWALKQPDNWQKWITLLLAYTGARRGEIGKLEKSQIKFDKDSQRYYFLIAEGGQGKIENATRQVVIHPKLIEWGFMEYVNRQWKKRIFSEVAGTNMTKIGKCLRICVISLVSLILMIMDNSDYCIPFVTRSALRQWLVG